MVPGWTAAAIATHEATDRTANPPRKRNVSVSWNWAKHPTTHAEGDEAEEVERRPA